MWRFANRRHFWLTLSAFMLFGSVAFQEHLEFTLEWPWWAQGIRVGIEEGTELLGVFLLLSVVASATARPGEIKSLVHVAPRMETLISLRLPGVFITLLGFIPLGIFSAFAIEDASYRGIPATWLPFTLLNVTWMAACACAQKRNMYSKRFLLASFLALFFSLDQVIVFERVIDKNLIHGALGNWMFPCMAVVSMGIPTLRTRFNVLLLAALLPLSLLLIPSSNLLPWLVIPLQSLGIFWILSTELVATGHEALQDVDYETLTVLQGKSSAW
jgi:hypothetical protein